MSRDIGGCSVSGMQPLVVGLILASAFFHALWNAVLKRHRDPEAASVAILGVAAVLACAALPFAGGAMLFPSGSGLAWALAAGVFEGGYFLSLALALVQAPLGVVYTVSRGGALAAVWPISALWLGETVTALSVAGALAVAVGLALVGLDRRGRASARGVFWAVLCALCIGGYNLCYKCALSTGAQGAAIFAAALAVALPINIARLGRGSLRRMGTLYRASPLMLGAAGVLCTASFLIFLLALAREGVGAVTTLRNTSVVFALVFACVIGERPGAPQIAGTLGVALGAVLLGWPR